MSETSERLKSYWSRVTSGDRVAHLTLSGSAAAIVLIVALIAWLASGSDPSSSKDNDADKLANSPTETSGDLGDLSVGSAGETPQPGSSGRSSGTVSAGGETTTDGGEVKEGTPELPPLTATTMKVGIAYTSDAGSTNQAAGFAGIGQVEQKRAWDAVIKDINKNPPHGRKIVPVYYAVTEREIISKGSERIQQEACAKYTQDNKVFMVWDGSVGGEVLSQCLTKARVPEVGGAFDSETMKKYPYLVSPSDATRDRMVSFEVDQLHKNGFFSKFKTNPAGYTPVKPPDGKPRIGLIRYDEPEWDVAATAMKNRLKAHGLALCAGCEFEISYSADNPQEQLDDATEVNAAIQNCKAKNCTHMLFIGTTAGVRIPLFYIDGAEKQRYRAMLGFNPEDAPTTVYDFYGSSNEGQFTESMIVADSPAEFDETSPGYARCKKTLEAAGETFEGQSGSNKLAQMPVFCDSAWYTQAVLLQAGRDLTLDSWTNAVNTMKPVSSASVYLMQTKAGRRDGSGAVRTGRWAGAGRYAPITPITPV